MKTATIFFNNALNKTDSTIFCVDYVNINIKNNSEKNPYFKSIEMLKKLISEITEDSRLFEAFLYFDCDIIENILMKNTQTEYNFQNIFGKITQVRQPEYLTEYGMSLMTVKEIKGHLLALLPSIIIKVDNNLNMRALYVKKTKLMIINELQIFGKLSTFNGELSLLETDKYIVPLSMEILHEILAHGKLRYIFFLH